MNLQESTLTKITTVLSLAILATSAGASILASTPGSFYTNNGYDESSWGTFSTMLDTASDNSMQIVGDLENSAQVQSADALWIDQRENTAALSSAEVQNIQNFVATGKRIVIIGENDTWADWNTQVANLLGGTYTGGGAGTPTTVLSHALTAGVSEINPISYGSASGGTSLFSTGIATLYGPSQNALLILDSNMFSDSYISTADNTAFAQNVADWVAIPEPATLGLFGLFGGGIFAVRRTFMI